jgi:hypothetical protein
VPPPTPVTTAKKAMVTKALPRIPRRRQRPAQRGDRDARRIERRNRREDIRCRQVRRGGQARGRSRGYQGG